MPELGDFRAITDLCERQTMADDAELCRETVEGYKSALMGYCYGVQTEEDPTDLFCMTALPQPAPQTRTYNILGDGARTGRLLVVPHLPVEHDGLPEPLQDAFDEDTYEAIMNGEPLSEIGSGAEGAWRLSLKFQYDLVGMGDEIGVEGSERTTVEGDDGTTYWSHFGCRLDGAYRFDFGLKLSAGVDYLFKYGRGGGDIHTFDGVVGAGFSFETGEFSMLEMSVIAKLGYLFSTGGLYHAVFAGPFDMSGLDAAIGADIEFIFGNGSLWSVLIGIEGARTFTSPEEDGLKIIMFPYSLLLTVGAAIG